MKIGLRAPHAVTVCASCAIEVRTNSRPGGALVLPTGSPCGYGMRLMCPRCALGVRLKCALPRAPLGRSVGRWGLPPGRSARGRAPAPSLGLFPPLRAGPLSPRPLPRLGRPYRRPPLCRACWSRLASLAAVRGRVPFAPSPVPPPRLFVAPLRLLLPSVHPSKPPPPPPSPRSPRGEKIGCDRFSRLRFVLHAPVEPTLCPPMLWFRFCSRTTRPLAVYSGTIA